jgi:DNA-binding NarL/FixJ family response regulator
VVPLGFPVRRVGSVERARTEHRPGGTQDAIRVLLAGGHFLFRQAVRTALDGEPDITVVGEAASEEEAIASLAGSPDVVVMDATLGAEEIVRTIERIVGRDGRCGVVFIATSKEDSPVTDVIEAGARAYLAKEATLADLIDCVRGVHRGEMLIPPSLVGPLLDDLLDRRRDQREAYEILDRLTPREREVLLLLGGGANNRTIAHELRISEGTARTHVQNLLGKLQVHSRADAAAFVRRSDLLRSRALRLEGRTRRSGAPSIGSLAAADHEGDVVALVGSDLPVAASDRGASSQDTQQEGSLTV